MKQYAMLLVALVMSAVASAQVKVTGVVTDDQGEPLIGAAVRVDGSNEGVLTDMNGRYTITLPKGKSRLQVSYVGFEPKTVTPKGGRADIVLTDNNPMDEVVVVGYGVMKKSDLSGSSSTISEKDLKTSIISSLDQALQGKATGVTAVTTSGAPGSSSSIRVRGIASINANQEPLYVVDGVIFQGSDQSGAGLGLGDRLGNGKVSTVSPLSTLNPSDIVSMEILKDASACAIYGAQGANGVVLITTKRGQAGEAKISYDGMVAVNRQMKRLDMMNLREFAEYYKDFRTNGFVLDKNANSIYADPSILGKGTNWQDAVFQTALQHQHQVSAEGGTDVIRYYVSGNYMDQDGTIIGSHFGRYAFRANLDAQVTRWLKLGLSATYSNTRDDLKRADGEEG
ncbi:MAG: SusC/RagA family TonB-linked outer membrane protein, partial [Bacteroidaceae bacterium]|nr:SusC/RagA family TonB-linked outer membrane protein [Bacteroidaceae bacterium]